MICSAWLSNYPVDRYLGPEKFGIFSYIIAIVRV